MNKFLKLLFSFLTIGIIGTTSSCMGEETVAVQTLASSSGNIAFYGTQDVVLKFRAPDYQGETPIEVSTFKSTITAKDISFKYMLVGREVKALKYLNPTTIALTLEGDSRNSPKVERNLGNIVVSGKAIENGIPSFCAVTVVEPCLVHKSDQTSGGKKIYTYTSNFNIIVGNFTKPFVSEYVELVDKTNGTLKIEVIEEDEDGILLTTVIVKVSNFIVVETIKQPSVKFVSASNTLGLSFIEKVG
ncbi:MAG: hypothetical protein RSB95_03935, partial [Bacilli bacterium]